MAQTPLAVSRIGPGGGMTRIRRVFQHILNPLHVYCRLKDVGVPAPMAQRVCRVYERFLFRFLP